MRIGILGLIENGNQLELIENESQYPGALGHQEASVMVSDENDSQMVMVSE